MRVSLEASGGFTGLRRTAEVDTSDLVGPDAAVLDDALVRLARDTGEPAPSPSPHYTLTFTHGDTEHRLVLTEPHLPDELRPLIAELRRRSRPVT